VICTPVGSNASEIEMTIHEGRNRQIRRMCEAIGHPVRALRRIAIGSLSLDDLPEGQWRTASKEDLDKMTGES
jgi:23S rRNA pseudouridine2605 synthase